MIIQLIAMLTAGICLAFIGGVIVRAFPSQFTVFALVTVILFIGWAVPSPIDFAAIGGGAVRP